MIQPLEKKSIDEWDGEAIPPGSARDVKMAVGESYSGISVHIPLHVRRAMEPGPTVFVTAALHGDEINGTGAVRQLMLDSTFELKRGAVILVPVVNVLAFDRHSRYLPDRRDLNRCFPGAKDGSLASRMARAIFDQIVSRADYGIDLHTAAVRRTNFPNLRADMSNEQVQRLAEAFGCEFILDGKGPAGSFRREVTRAGVPTIVLEGGEVWKVESTIVDTAVRGIRNVLIELEMLDGQPDRPQYQQVIKNTKWMRAQRSGFLQFHVSPGEIVNKDQPLATNTSLLGQTNEVITAPAKSVVIGMTTLPATSPGEPVCHLGMLDGAQSVKRIQKQLASDELHERVAGDLATNVHIVEHEPETDG